MILLRFETVGSKPTKTQQRIGIGSMLQCGESNKIFHLVKIGKIGSGRLRSLRSLSQSGAERRERKKEREG